MAQNLAAMMIASLFCLRANAVYIDSLDVRTEWLCLSGRFANEEGDTPLRKGDFTYNEDDDGSNNNGNDYDEGDNI